MFDKYYFDKMIDFLWPEEGCLELIAWRARVIKSNNTYTKSDYNLTIGGRFNDRRKLCEAAKSFVDVSAYISLNPVRPDDQPNTVRKLSRGEPATDKDVIALRHVLIDIDSSKPKEASATDEEMAPAIALRDRILFEHPRLIPASIWGQSGNGAYIVSKINYPNEIKYSKQIKNSLLKFQRVYGGREQSAFIDPNPAFPCAHVCLAGTRKCKGSYSKERPWRTVTVDGTGQL